MIDAVVGGYLFSGVSKADKREVEQGEITTISIDQGCLNQLRVFVHCKASCLLSSDLFIQVDHCSCRFVAYNNKVLCID
jgi:hypothetical protein